MTATIISLTPDEDAPPQPLIRLALERSLNASDVELFVDETLMSSALSSSNSNGKIVEEGESISDIEPILVRTPGTTVSSVLMVAGKPRVLLLPTAPSRVVVRNEEKEILVY